MDLTKLKGIGPKTVEQLHNLGIDSLQDILFHLPFRYQDRTRIVPISTLRPGDQVVIEGNIISSKVKFARKRQLHVLIEDASGTVLLKFFYFNNAQQKNLIPGVKLRCYGETRLSKRQLVIVHPEYRRISEDSDIVVEEYLTPIYPSTEGLQQTKWQQLSQQALNFIRQDNELLEIIPEDILKKFSLVDIKQALNYVHRPAPDADQELLEQGLHPMQQRLAFEELLAHQLSLRQSRMKMQQHRAFPFQKVENREQKVDLISNFLTLIGFELTKAQQKVMTEITSDLIQAKPMMRLLQGDVGSGKTVIAALAALQVISHKKQVAIMAPTELLAEQHYQQFKQWFEPLGIKVVWLSGKLKTAERREVLQLIVNGEADLMIGTHALFQKQVAFFCLALVIIDEQHRFGVAQRLALREKGINADIFPHQLIMTATPIPRTLAMTVYADLDTSIIDQLPPGRTPVETIVVNNNRRDEVINKVKNLCDAGGQVYWVCPLIEVSELLASEAAEKIVEILKVSLPECRIALVHGRLKVEQKQFLMQAFKKGEIDLLVATTVIEVGINVPNATLMVIENPERMGLAQLHQLRGRVGRGAKESYCILLYQEPLSENARRRLTVMRESNDGFYIAEQDLKFRGPGEVLGTRQSGLQRLKIANIIRDRKLLPDVQQAAKLILKYHFNIVEPLKQRWLGSNEEFVKV